MPSFKKLNTKIFQRTGPVLTPDYIYWKQFKAPVFVKEFGSIDYIDFSPVSPYNFAVTCSVRIQVYNPITKLVVKNLSKFKECAYGGVFRSDGKLLCAGSEEAAVKLFDVSTKNLLRLFKGHAAPVHRTFFINNKPQIASFSDDKTVKIWDIATEQCISSFDEHSDYIRAGAVSPMVSDFLISGGYDNLVKLYDLRTNTCSMEMNHGYPVESLLFLPSGGLILSAGGTSIKVWDIINGGKLLGDISHHHKTITCLGLASGNTRLLSGSLDRHVNIYDLSSFKVVHTLNYPSSVLSLAISKTNDTFVAGLTNGLVSVSRREEENVKNKTKVVSYKYKLETYESTVDLTIPQTVADKETKYDHHLRKFEHSKALDCVLQPYICNKSPQITVSVIQELVRRRALQKVLQGRDSKFLMKFLKFFIRNITDYKFTKVLIDAANIFINIYENNMYSLSADVKSLTIQLVEIIKKELQVLNNLAQLQGLMHMILSATSTIEENESSKENYLHLKPSTDAQKKIIVNLT